MADVEADDVALRNASSVTHLMGFEGLNPGTTEANFGKYALSSMSNHTFLGWFGDLTTADASAVFVAAVASLATTGGTITIPATATSIKAFNIPLDTGTPNFKPIVWLGAGPYATKVEIAATASTAPLFISSFTGQFKGGGVLNMELIGDGQGGTGVSNNPADLKSATSDCIDLQSTSQIYQFLVDRCFIHNFKIGCHCGADSRSIEFGTNHWWFNEMAIRNRLDHPLFTGVNDFRSNYIGIGGESMFDCQVGNQQKFIRNHYGMKFDNSIASSAITGAYFFKNKKQGIVNNGGNNKISSGCLFVPADQVGISSITTSGQIVTVNTTTDHFLETGDDVVHWDVTGLSLSIDETVYTATRTSDTQYTFDHGVTITGTAANGNMTGCMSGIEDTNGGVDIDDNFFRRDTSVNRFGIADIYINGSGGTLTRTNIKLNRFSGSGSAALLALKQTAIAYDAGDIRACNIDSNTFQEFDVVLKRVAGRFDQGSFSNNNIFVTSTDGLAATEDVVDLSDSTFGNKIQGNQYSVGSGSAPITGRYIINADVPRTMFQSNIVRYRAANFTAAFNITGFDSDMIGATGPGTTTGSTDTAGTKSHNIVTSF